MMGGQELRRENLWRVLAAAVPSSFLSQLGFYAMLPLLPALLAGQWHVTSGWETGVALFVLSVSMRAAAVLLSRMMRTWPLRLSVCGGLSIAALSFGSLGLANQVANVVVLLGVAGVGISVSGMALRVFATESLQSSDRRTTVFSAIQVGANLAAAAGPILGALLLSSSATALLCWVASAYVAAAIVSAIFVPPTRPRTSTERPPLTKETFTALVLDRKVRAAAITSATGCFLYAQLFSSISIHLLSIAESGPLRSSVFVVNALLVVAIQAPISMLMNRRMRGGTAPFAFMRGGVSIFAGAYLVMALLGGTLPGVLLAVVVFSIAEAFFTPMLNTAFAGIGAHRSQLELFNMRQISTSIGESAGSLVGGAVFALSQAAGWNTAYWGALAVLAISVVSTVRK
ncbi:MFS transporter [Arthrobacter sp. MI7-26]|uniref:MFS transporter n=1 Tax=Arthrobacter sp. MI7-26 TaxID=2993653 RepID=UPI002B0577B8|nr:MFS transporter [Arthrobacter sp. MI7-26]